MSFFLVFGSKGGEFVGSKASTINIGPKADHNNLQVVMVREKEDSGLWISLCKGENLWLKSIIPYGDFCKGKISFQRCLHVISFIII